MKGNMCMIDESSGTEHDFNNVTRTLIFVVHGHSPKNMFASSINLCGLWSLQFERL